MPGSNGGKKNKKYLIIAGALILATLSGCKKGSEVIVHQDDDGFSVVKSTTMKNSNGKTPTTETVTDGEGK